VVWTDAGDYGHVAILRGYQQEGENELLSSYPQDAKGEIVAVFDEMNAGGAVLDHGITNRFGLVTPKTLPVSTFDRSSKTLTLTFHGMILPMKNN